LRTLRSWGQDRLLWGIVKNSSYLFSSNSAAIVLSMLQGILAARLLGVEGYGVVAGAVIPAVSFTNRLLSFRMSELIVKYLGQSLEKEDTRRGAAVVKAAGLVEIGTAGLGYLVLLAAAPLAAQYLLKDPQLAPLIVFYGLVVLSNGLYETSVGVLQTVREFKSLALVNFFQSLITAGIITWAYFNQRGMQEVLLAYLIGKSFAGAAVAVLAARQAHKTFGPGWLGTPFGFLLDRRGMARFAVSTNLSQTVNLVARDSETMIIAFLRSPLEAGYYRVALAVLNMVMLPIDPFISATYTEITRMVARREWGLTRRVLKRVSAIGGAWTLIAGLGLALFGRWLIPFLYKAEFSPVYPAMLVLLIGYGFANTFNWNRTLLLALGLPTYPLKVSAVIGGLKTVLVFALVGTYGYILQAALLSAYFVIQISLILSKGLGEIRRREIEEPAPVTVEMGRSP
jgi:O-antigen/teichoic acid export membrane protein